MTKKPKMPRTRERVDAIARPFWEKVAGAALDRFFLDRLLRALLRRWREERFARVKQGGIHGDARAELSRVFIDLDASSGLGGQEGPPGSRRERIIASWMQRTARRRPPRGAIRVSGEFAPAPVEVVLGGPGQGKSTVGRFLVLIHAAILLLTCPTEGLVPPADKAHMMDLLEGLATEDIPLPDRSRLPIWIELRELTDALLQDEESGQQGLQALLRWYATNELNEALDAGPLETALTTLPSVIIFDGLDEVPPHRGRVLVQACVAGVRGCFASAERTDGWVIGTSRPQSYDRQVFGDDIVERTLLPLTNERASTYTHRFAECLLTEDGNNRKQFLQRMKRALDTPSTAALMKNPLLVTIMASIVLHHGEPTDRRWKLFEDYYRTIYGRETERGTYASATLREHADLIHSIHRHVGLSLQVRSEESEGVSALVLEAELRQILHQRLLERFDDVDATRLTNDILAAAEQRLVFLVQAQTGKYGFELRSFQEFMAAWQIVSLREAQTDELLPRVAPLAAWRNVMLFVVGHQFANNSPLAWARSVGLCQSLDETTDVGAKLTMPGARLALGILADAPYGTAPRRRNELLACALALLRVPPEQIHSQLGETIWERDQRQLCDTLDKALADQERREAAWATLAALPETADTTALAERHWPRAPDEAKATARGLFRLRSSLHGPRVPKWLVKKITQDLSLLEPSDYRLLRDYPGRFVWIRAGRGRMMSGWLIGSTGERGAEGAWPSLVLPDSSDWALVRAAESFREQPDPHRLAEVLEGLAAGWQDGFSSQLWADFIPWQLFACLLAAGGAEDLRSTAARLRRGELGSREEWSRMSQKGQIVATIELEALALSADPLEAIMVKGGVPLLSGSQETLPHFVPGDFSVEDIAMLDKIRRMATSDWVRRMLAAVIVTLIEGVVAVARPPLTLPLSVEDAIQIVSDAGRPLSLRLLELLSQSVGSTGVVAVLTRTEAPIVAPRQGWLAPTLLPKLLLSALGEAPGDLRLQRALVVALQHGLMRGAPPAFGQASGDGMDACLLRLASGTELDTDLPSLVDGLAACDDPHEVQMSLRLIARSKHARPHLYPLIAALLSRPGVSTSVKSAAVAQARDTLVRCSSRLSSPDEWQAAGLPLPAPMLKISEPPEAPGVHLSRLEIINLRAFPQSFEVMASAAAGEGQWMLFLGENATGKTTLLRAIAMALASPSDAAAVPSNVEGPLRREPAREGVVRVRASDGREFVATVVGASGEERVLAGPDRVMRPWVVGYGCRRGSAVSGTDMDNAFLPFRDLDNLFDRPRGMVRASGWLKELQRLARNNGARSRMVFEAAREALRKVLLGAEEIVVENDVFVGFSNNRRVPLALLSDGYLTTAGWVVDLMARWLKRNEGHKGVDENFCSVMEGVVLLDEIDLHLHPRWQERVIEDVRLLFPKMTFVATTHHPLTLRGARKGEVFVLADHDGTGAVTAVQRDIPPGTRVDELLTGAWFNRPSAIVDAETRTLLDKHQRLILAGAKAGSAERKALEAELRKRLGRYADTSLERLAATIVAQHLDQDLPEPSAEKREQVRAQVMGILKRRDAKRK